jgi:4,4'-diaponeurosporenoate glycosyltransferase
MDVPLRPVLLGLGWLVGWCLLVRVRGLPLGVGDAGEASIVIPARDEATTISTLLDALARQTSRPGEVIVVDDGSSDGTADIARAHGAHVISGEPVPDGWAGKPWAMRQGARLAHHDTLVFLDADTVPAPGFLSRLVATCTRAEGLVSVQPFHRMRQWWERAAAFFNVVAVMGTGMASLRPNARITGAFGPCLACRKADLLRHIEDESVRSAVLEDVALSRRFAAAGQPVTAFGGRDLLDFRMYERPRELVEGFGKNIAAGAAATPPVRLVLIIAWVTACLAATEGLWRADWIGLGFYAAFAIQLFVMLRQLGCFGLVTAALYPAPAAVFVMVFLWSIVLVACGEVRWKGRRIRLRS